MNKLRTLQTIHLAYCVGPLLFTGVVLFINYPSQHLSFETISSDPLLIVAPLMAIFSIVVSRIVFNSLLSKINTDLSSSISNKFTQYQTAFIVKAAFLEGAALFNIVVFLMTSNLLTLFFAIACIIFLWFSRPTKEKISDDLNLPDTNSLNGI